MELLNYWHLTGQKLLTSDLNETKNKFQKQSLMLSCLVNKK